MCMPPSPPTHTFLTSLFFLLSLSICLSRVQDELGYLFFIVIVVVFVFVGVVLLFGSYVAYMLDTVCECACYFDMSLLRLSTHIPNSHCVAYIYIYIYIYIYVVCLEW